MERIERIAFTQQVPVFRGVEPVKIYEESAPFKNEEKGNDDSGLLIGSLSALGAFGLGMLARKPKTVEKIIEKVVKEEAPKAANTVGDTVKKLTPKEQEAAWKAAVKDNVYLYVAKKASKGAITVTDDMIKASNPQISSELNPEFVKLRHDMQARAALADAEKINKHSLITEEKIMQSNPQMRPAELTGDARTAKELELLEAFNPKAYKNRMIGTINHKNSLERAEKNTIGNLVSNKENRALNKQKIKADIVEKMSKFFEDGIYKNPAGKGNFTYVVENGKITKIFDKQTVKGKAGVITDEKKIAKHLAKYDVSVPALKKINAPKKALNSREAA